MKRTGVLFVCLGNICRSPLARIIFEDMAAKRGVRDRFNIDSCGTGHWHEGGPADPRTVAVAEQNGLKCTHVARVFDADTDVQQFGRILVADTFIRETLLRRGVPADRIELLRSFDPESHGATDVPDPYEHGPKQFEEMYAILTRCCQELLDDLLEETE